MTKKLPTVILLGDTSVGKTSLAIRINHNRFNNYPDCTIGVSFMTIKTNDVSFELWDTAGQERYLSLIPSYYRRADIILLVFDITNETSIERIKFLLEKIKNDRADKDYSLIFVGNKIDQSDGDFYLLSITNTIQELLEKHDLINSKLVYVSAKSRDGIDELLSKITEECIKFNDNKDIDIIELPLDNNHTSKYKYCTC